MNISRTVALLVTALLLLTGAACVADKTTMTSVPTTASLQTTATRSPVVSGTAPLESITTATTSQTVAATASTGKMTPSTMVAASDDGLAEEYVVYTALIQSQYANRLVVIEDTTVQPESGLFSPTEGARFMRQYHRDLGDEIWDDFVAKNDKPSVLERRFSLSAEYVLVGTAEIESIFSGNANGWDDFYAKYPGSQGVLTLSRVGFNEARDTAVLYAGNQSHWVAGQGNMVLMKKTAGRWTVLGEVMMWIS